MKNSFLFPIHCSMSKYNPLTFFSFMEFLFRGFSYFSHEFLLTVPEFHEFQSFGIIHLVRTQTFLKDTNVCLSGGKER